MGTCKFLQFKSFALYSPTLLRILAINQRRGAYILAPGDALPGARINIGLQAIGYNEVSLFDLPNLELNGNLRAT